MKKKLLFRLPLIFMGLLILVALLADILANEKPLYCVYKTQTYFPAFSSARSDTLYLPSNDIDEIIIFKDRDWHAMSLKRVIWAPIPYGVDYVDKFNQKKLSPFAAHYYKKNLGEKASSPFRFRHHLGTDKQGRDLLARLIHGSRVSLIVSLLAVSLAAIIGILLGTLAAFWGDHQLKIPRATFFLVIIGIPIAYYYAFILRQYTLTSAASVGIGSFLVSLSLSFFIFVGIISLCVGIALIFFHYHIGSKSLYIPIDSFISRVIELLNSLPKILLLLTIAAIFKPSLYLLALVIGFTGWTGIARFVRAEVLRLKELEYVQATRAMGFSNWRIMFKHIIPHALTPIWIVLAFSIGDVIIVEAALSFINVGVPFDVVSWGKLLPKDPLGAWWLALFPGLAIFLTVLSANILGEQLRDVLDPKET